MICAYLCIPLKVNKIQGYKKIFTVLNAGLLVACLKLNAQMVPHLNNVVTMMQYEVTETKEESMILSPTVTDWVSGILTN